MNLRLLILIAIIGVGAYYHFSGKGNKPINPALVSQNGFVSLPASTAGANGVTVFSPPGCPSEEAQRARALVDKLAARSIPVTNSSNVNFLNVSGQEEMDRIKKVMESAGPVVIVNGKGKANPTFEEILAEYKG